MANDSGVLISGCFALGGVVVGSIASIVGPALVSSSRAKRDADRVYKTERGRLLRLFIDNMLGAAEYPTPFTVEAPRRAAAEMRRAQMDLQLFLREEDSIALEYLTNLVRILGGLRDEAMRWGTAEQGGQELIAWHREQKHDFSPFRFIGYSSDQRLLVERLDHW